MTVALQMDKGPVRPLTRQFVMGVIQAHFPPEFIDRRTLSRKNILRIVDLCLKEVQDRLSDRKINLVLDDEVKSYLRVTARGYSPVSGTPAHPLSVILLADRIQDGEVIRVCFDGLRNRLHIVPNHEGNEVDGMEADDYDYDSEIEEMDYVTHE
ncbi:hypothetical protein BGW80DRAFT_1435357 [Lactifluus volemus]|nr:hypothetical protein BGW80DRAFT_1435357 [Lactifluus volemus]